MKSKIALLLFAFCGLAVADLGFDVRTPGQSVGQCKLEIKDASSVVEEGAGTKVEYTVFLFQPSPKSDVQKAMRCSKQAEAHVAKFHKDDALNTQVKALGARLDKCLGRKDAAALASRTTSMTLTECATKCADFYLFFYIYFVYKTHVRCNVALASYIL